MSALENFPRITPFLWFDSNAEEAVIYRTAIEYILGIRRQGDVLVIDPVIPRQWQGFDATLTCDGTVYDIAIYNPLRMNRGVVSIELDGQRFTALNGGPRFKFTEGVSFMVRCDTQQEVDEYWSKLTADGGTESQCCWLKDKFGLSWQIVPATLPDLLKNPKAVQAFMHMKKPDIGELERAARS